MMIYACNVEGVIPVEGNFPTCEGSAMKADLIAEPPLQTMAETAAELMPHHSAEHLGSVLSNKNKNAPESWYIPSKRRKAL